MSPIIDIDFNNYDESGFGVPAPGVYHVEVAEVQQRKTRNGDPMLNVKLIHVGTKKMICYDNICLAGGGANMGIAKLIELGAITKESPSLDTEKMIGRRVAITVHQTEYEGKRRAEVDIRASAPFKCGYMAEAKAIEHGVVGDATPF